MYVLVLTFSSLAVRVTNKREQTHDFYVTKNDDFPIADLSSI